jgi:hypothetical protein
MLGIDVGVIVSAWRRVIKRKPKKKKKDKSDETDSSSYQTSLKPTTSKTNRSKLFMNAIKQANIESLKLTCPVCQTAFSEFGFETNEYIYCKNCFALCFKNDSLPKLIRVSGQIPIVEHNAKHSKLNCPSCNLQMKKAVFTRKPFTQVANCTCGFTFLPGNLKNHFLSLIPD